MICIAASVYCAAGDPAFDVASVKLVVDQNGPRNKFSYGPEGIEIGGCTLAFIIAEAYDYPVARLVGPTSLTKESLWKRLSTGYDIAARTERPASKAELRLMLKSLLRDRVGLEMHHETRTGAVYNLIVASGGSKLEDSGSDQFSVSNSSAGMTFRNTSMVRLVSALSGMMDRPVIDHTGLKGFYNFVLKSSDDDSRDLREKKIEGASPDTPSAAGYDEALKRLGLQLVEFTGQIDYLVVDRVTAPSAN